MISISKRGLLAALASAALALMLPAQAADNSTPDGLIRQLSLETMEGVKTINASGGNVSKVIELINAKVMPNVDFQRMTSNAVGRFWRQATPVQQQALQDQFRILLQRTYAGALTQVKNQTIALRPLRAPADATEVVVHTEVRGSGDPIQLDYRLEKTDAGWKIFDVNVLGIWLADQYKNSFAQEIGANGIDGLIKALSDKNKAAGAN